VAREALDKAVLAAMGLIGHDDDVGAIRELGKGLAGTVGAKLLHRGKHHPTRGHVQQLAQLLLALGLYGGLAQQLLAGSEGAVELVVEIVAVGNDHQRGIAHRRMPDDLAGVEHHG